MILIKESFKLSYSNLKTFYGYVLTCWMKFKVIERVISPVAVFVMNDFPRFQGAAKCFRHNKTVLINLSSFICHRILRYIDLAIAMTGKFSMEWLCPVLDLPGKLYGAMATTTSINLGVSSSSLNVFHGNPPILKATTTCNQNSESVFSTSCVSVTDCIPVNDRIGVFDAFIAKCFELFNGTVSNLGHYYHHLRLYHTLASKTTEVQYAIS